MSLSILNMPAAPGMTRAEIVHTVIDLADRAYPHDASERSGAEARDACDARDARETLAAFLQDCRADDLAAIQALVYCGARYYSTYDDALEAARQDLDDHSAHALAEKRFLADWLRAGLACDESGRPTA